MLELIQLLLVLVVLDHLIQMVLIMLVVTHHFQHHQIHTTFLRKVEVVVKMVIHLLVHQLVELVDLVLEAVQTNNVLQLELEPVVRAAREDP